MPPSAHVFRMACAKATKFVCLEQKARCIAGLEFLTLGLEKVLKKS